MCLFYVLVLCACCIVLCPIDHDINSLPLSITHVALGRAYRKKLPPLPNLFNVLVSTKFRHSFLSSVKAEAVEYYNNDYEADSDSENSGDMEFDEYEDNGEEEYKDDEYDDNEDMEDN